MLLEAKVEAGWGNYRLPPLLHPPTLLALPCPLRANAGGGVEMRRDLVSVVTIVRGLGVCVCHSVCVQGRKGATAVITVVMRVGRLGEICVCQNVAVKGAMRVTLPQAAFWCPCAKG